MSPPEVELVVVGVLLGGPERLERPCDDVRPMHTTTESSMAASCHANSIRPVDEVGANRRVSPTVLSVRDHLVMLESPNDD